MPTYPEASLDNGSIVDAGEFGSWLEDTLKSFKTQTAAIVPCGACRACCTASYFITVKTTDTDALAAIPAPLLQFAPGLAKGDRVLGFRPDGTCPMFRKNECSIYPSRPGTCRSYDCRVLAAAGLMAGGSDKSQINERVHAWNFTYRDAGAVAAHDAVKRAAKFIGTSGHAFPEGRVPTKPADIAVLALKVHRVFMTAAVGTWNERKIANAIVASSSEFESELFG
jgi:hypothetical protein